MRKDSVANPVTHVRDENNNNTGEWKRKGVETMAIAEYKIKTRPLSSKVSAKLDCPHCNEPLTVAEDEIGHPDRCPTCNTGFRLSRKPLHEYRTAEASSKKAKAASAASRAAARASEKESEKKEAKAKSEAEMVRRKDELRRDRELRRERDHRRELVVSQTSTSDKLSSIASVMAAISRVLMYLCLAAAVVLLMAAMAVAMKTHFLLAIPFLIWIGAPLSSAFFFGLCRVGCLAALKLSE